MNILAPLNVTEKEIKEDKVKVYNPFLNIEKYQRLCFVLWWKISDTKNKFKKTVSLFGQIGYPV